MPSAEDACFSPASDSIFFHVTTCRDMLNSRQACAIESAARAHPGRKIYVLFIGPINQTIQFNISSHSELKNDYPNIRFMRLHINEYVKNTALEEFMPKTHNKTQCQIVHSSDWLKFLTMYKFGGVSLDMDLIVVKELDDLGQNWVARESNIHIGSAVLNVAKDFLGQEFMTRVLELVPSFLLLEYFSCPTKTKNITGSGPKTDNRWSKRVLDWRPRLGKRIVV